MPTMKLEIGEPRHYIETIKGPFGNVSKINPFYA